MKQKKNRPVRINIQNKDLWEKEAKLIKRWKQISNIWCIIAILTFIGIWPFCEFGDTLPKWVGLAYALWYVIGLCFGGVFVLGKYERHKVKFIEYKYGMGIVNKAN